MPNDNVIAFLPGKAGSGASITAVNVADCLARIWKQQVLLIDGDFNSGLLSFLLSAAPRKSITDALETSDRLDEVWATLVSSTPRLDLLPAPTDRRRPKVSLWNYQRFLAHVRARYQAAIVDLPDVVDEATEPLVKVARYVCIVCTPETTSLLLAKERIAMVKKLGVSESYIGIVLNCCTEADPKKSDIEEILQKPVLASLPRDDRGVRRSIVGGRLVEEGSRLGKGFCFLAQALIGREPPTQRQTGWRSWMRKSQEDKRPVSTGAVSEMDHWS